MTGTVRLPCPRIYGDRPYLFLVDPLQLRPDSASTAISWAKRPRPVRQLKRIAHPLQHPGCPTVPSSTSPRQPGMACMYQARRHSNTYSARSALSFKASPRICCKLYSPLESIKWEGKELSGGDRGQRTKKEDRHLPRF
jgi:hypothetical protein